MERIWRHFCGHGLAGHTPTPKHTQLKPATARINSNLARATAFYEAVLGQKMRHQNMGPFECAVFAYDEAAGGGAAQVAGRTLADFLRASRKS